MYVFDSTGNGFDILDGARVVATVRDIESAKDVCYELNRLSNENEQYRTVLRSIQSMAQDPRCTVQALDVLAGIALLGYKEQEAGE